MRYQTRGKLNMRNIIILDNLFVMVLFVENHLNICYQIVHIDNAKFLCNIEIPWFYLRERLLESLGIIRPLLIHIILKKYENEKSFKYSLSVSMYFTVYSVNCTKWSRVIAMSIPVWLFCTRYWDSVKGKGGTKRLTRVE